MQRDTVSSLPIQWPDTDQGIPDALSLLLSKLSTSVFVLHRDESTQLVQMRYLAGASLLLPFKSSSNFCQDLNAFIPDTESSQITDWLMGDATFPLCMEVSICHANQTRYVTKLILQRDATQRQFYWGGLLDQTVAADQRDYLQSLFDNMSSMMWAKDKEGRILFANAAYYEWTGQSLLGVAGQQESEWLPSAEVEAFMEEDRKVMASQSKLETEGPASNQFGEVRWFDSWKSAVVSHGEAIGTIGFARDMTFQRSVQSDVQLKEMLLEHARDMVMLISFEEPVRLTYVNREACVALGYSRDALKSMPLSEIDGGGLVSQIDLSGHHAITAERIRFEASCLRKDGTTIPVEVTGAHLLFADNVYFLAMLRDITATKQAENALREREQEFRTLAENSSDSIARFDVSHRVKYINPAFSQLFGCASQSAQWQTPVQLFGEVDGTVYVRYLNQTISSKAATQFEMFWSSSDQERFCVLIRLTPELDHEGNVISVLAIGRDVSELNDYRQKVHHLAFFDNLTGLPNRAMFQDSLSQMLHESAQYQRQSAVMLIDLDLFKEVNDTLGHPVGDQLLCQVANRLKSKLRSNDLVARLGGDEFAVLFPEIIHKDDVAVLASKLLAAFEAPFWIGGREMFMTGSVGIAYYPDDATSSEDLVRYADAAMYAAKRAGRNSFRCYNSEMTRLANERLALEVELRQALARQQMVLRYQPKVSLDDGTVVGSEALIRWQHPELGLISPDRFIPLAEESALIVDIGRWVLKEACLTVSEWNRQAATPHRMAINLSAKQFHSSSLVDEIPAILEITNCQPDWIELEITESLLLHEDEQVLRDLQRLRIMGITIAIDDFGTGFSALSYLTHFPIDTLKIDRSFISSVTSDPYKAGLVRAMISMADCLGQTVVAEGVEDMDQAMYLRQNGCQIAQGYLFGKAVSKAEFEQLPTKFFVPQDDYVL
ncbi:EAL domain-containing protein [Leeia sp. TBRC 13508]|uniref:EAL domain-containing protein n=1 Tax=Leeia speluncae TaxID=2884804 RepID=A0ABS8D726_9NEIS|nr:bifunctional diguanylate cyclase/phosphodiesterase [Leeia speluncae]MCB6184000.1 EAL domain-containing protein [Leeia speluncae]